MKILYVNTLYAPDIGGGAEITLKKLVEGIAQRGNEVKVVCLGENGGLIEEIQNGVNVSRISIANAYRPYARVNRPPLAKILWHARDSYNKKMRNELGKVLDEYKPDLISFHNIAGWSCAVWEAAAIRGLPSVQVLHDMYSICPSSSMCKGGKPCTRQCFICRIYRIPHKHSSRSISAVVGVSKFVLDAHLKHGLFGNATVKRYIHNVRDAQPLQQQRDSASSDLVYGYIGTLSEIKGVRSLIEDFQSAAIPGTKLLIAGTGEPSFEESLKRISGDNVEFIGYASTESFFPKIDILVVPSLWNEPLGMVIPEAFSFGKPVIASRRGGIPEMLEHGFSGLLYEPLARGDLSCAMTKLAENEQLREYMASNARLASSRFTDIDGWIAKYQCIYNEITGNVNNA